MAKHLYPPRLPLLLLQRLLARYEMSIAAAEAVGPFIASSSASPILLSTWSRLATKAPLVFVVPPGTVFGVASLDILTEVVSMMFLP